MHTQARDQHAQVRAHGLVPEPGREETSYRLEEEKARKAERVERAVAFFCTLTIVAGIAFIIFYAAWPGHVGNIDRAIHSNDALSTALTLAFGSPPTCG